MERVILMEFFDDLGKTISSVAKQVEEKSGELIEIGRLNIEIFKEEDAIRKLSRKIGEVIYEAYSEDKEYAELADDLCYEIGEKKKRIDSLRAKISEVRKANKDTQSEENDGFEENEEEKAREPEISYYSAMVKMNEQKRESPEL